MLQYLRGGDHDAEKRPDLHATSTCAKRLEYYRLTQPDADGVQYGAAIRSLSPDTEDYAAVPAITVCPGRIERLLALLSEHTVTPTTLRDVVEDLL